MALKSALTPLSRIETLSPDQLELLRGYSLTTVEELVGMIEASPRRVGQLLQMDEQRLADLKAEAHALLAPHVREELARQREKLYPLGALDPRTRRPGA